MYALIGRGWCQKLYTCNVGLNSTTFSSVNCCKFSQSHFRGATRILQKDRICSDDGHVRKLNTLIGSQLPDGLHKEQRRRCVTHQAAVCDDQPGASFIRMILPRHQRPNGIVHGSVLFEDIIQTATMAANRYCSREMDKGEGGEQKVTLCFVSSFDYLKYIHPLWLIDACFVKANNVTATSDHLLQVEVSLEKRNPFKPDVPERVNMARLTFITNSHHDWSRRHDVTSQMAITVLSDGSHRAQPTPPAAMELDQTNFSKLMPAGTSLSFIQPYDARPPQEPFCRPGHACKLMEDHGIITASRLTHHDVTCVHVGMVTFHENIKMGNVVATSGEVVSTAKDVVTVFQTISSFSYDGAKIRKRCAAEGLFSYVPINSARERVPIPGQQVLSGHGQSFLQDKEVDIDHDIVDSYVNALKKL